MASSAAENITASGITIPTTTARPLALKAIWKRGVSPRGERSSPIAGMNIKVTASEPSESRAVASDAVNTVKNFPMASAPRETGLARMVSMVPRSFSPAVRSMAGYMAPVRQRMMIM